MSIFRPSRGPSPFSWIAKLHGEGKLPLAKPAPEIIEESPAEAAARRAAEFQQLTNPAPVIATAEAIIRAGAIGRGELQVFTAPPQPERRTPLTAAEQKATAAAIVEAYDRFRVR
jgi:hypothetical protein